MLVVLVRNKWVLTQWLQKFGCGDLAIFCKATIKELLDLFFSMDMEVVYKVKGTQSSDASGSNLVIV